MEFPRQEYWSGLPFPTPGDLPDTGIEPLSPALARGFLIPESPGKFAKNPKSVTKASKRIKFLGIDLPKEIKDCQLKIIKHC